jgi:hypothetical protein
VEGLAASPKVRQVLGEHKVILNNAPAGQVAAAGYEPNAPDGIAASPKVRQQMAQRTTTAEYVIAPLK